MSEVEITIDREMCQGARQCSHVAPAVFSHGDDGTAVVIDPHGAPVDHVLKAAELCPNIAITLVVDGEMLHQGIENRERRGDAVRPRRARRTLDAAFARRHGLLSPAAGSPVVKTLAHHVTPGSPQGRWIGSSSRRRRPASGDSLSIR